MGNLQRFKGTKYGAKAARKANKKIKVIAGRLVRELGRKLPLASLGKYLADLKIFQMVFIKSVETVIRFIACMNRMLNVIQKAKST